LYFLMMHLCASSADGVCMLRFAQNLLNRLVACARRFVVRRVTPGSVPFVVDPSLSVVAVSVSVSVVDELPSAKAV
jgi:hypothetical protein